MGLNCKMHLCVFITQNAAYKNVLDKYQTLELTQTRALPFKVMHTHYHKETTRRSK